LTTPRARGTPGGSFIPGAAALVEVEATLFGIAGFGAVCATEIWIAADTKIEQRKKCFIECNNSSFILLGVYQAPPPTPISAALPMLIQSPKPYESLCNSPLK
jgi:hypothetical protein